MAASGTGATSDGGWDPVVPRGSDPGRLHGLTVVTQDGHRVGTVVAVYVDTEFALTEWAAVRTGRLRHHEVLVPLADAVAVEGHLQLPYPRSLVDSAPYRDPDEALSTAVEVSLFDHYGIVYAGATVTAADYPDPEPEPEPEDPASMVRSEERLTVRTRRVPVGQARLVKRRVTEVKTLRVPVTREVVSLVQGPLEEVEDEDGVEFGEEFTLYGDRPVVHREAVPVERVRLAVDDVPGEQTVTAARRREQIEVTDETQPDAVSRRPRR